MTYLIIISVSTGLALPRQFAALTAGYLFSLPTGILLATIATTLGCMLTYALSSLGLYHYVQRKFPQKTAAIQHFLSDATFEKALIIRLLPLGSNFITNIVAGATQTPFHLFVAGSFVGFIPQMILFTAIGHGISISGEHQTLITTGLTIIAVMIALGLFIRHKKRPKRPF